MPGSPEPEGRPGIARELRPRRKTQRIQEEPGEARRSQEEPGGAKRSLFKNILVKNLLI